MMSRTDYEKAKQQGLLFANLVSPNRKTQAAFSALIKEVEAQPWANEYDRQREVLTRLTGAIYDGLAHGNWIPY